LHAKSLRSCNRLFCVVETLHGKEEHMFEFIISKIKSLINNYGDIQHSQKTPFFLKEKIGNPDLFTGRKKELEALLNWVDKVKQETSKSTAIISRRKTGKTAVMQRLFNIVFNRNNGVIPFYYEIKETDQWLPEFSKDFFFTFIFQYIAYHSRKIENFIFLKGNYQSAIKAAQKEGLEYLIPHIQNFELLDNKGHDDLLWEIAREAPRTIAQHHNERIVQLIDEFQFINHFIYRDKECKNRMHNLAGSYLHTAEYKNAPLLVSGSWVGWLMDDLNKMLPGRFTIFDFGNIPIDEAIEMIYKYSDIEKIPVTKETAYIIADLTEGNPFYISSIFQSGFPDKDFSTRDGFLKVLNYETFDKNGIIRGTWMEYIQSAINRINDIEGKKIVLYICQNKHKEVTRNDIKKDLNLSLTNSELEDRMKALVKSDIINQGTTDFDYRAVQDNIFDKVFRGKYQKEIDGFDPKAIKNEYKCLYLKIQGEYNKYKGEFSEYVIINHLKYHAFKNDRQYKSMISNLPDDFIFVQYLSVWSYTASPIHKRDIQIDIFAKAQKDHYSLIGEVKNRKAKFTLKEAQDFLDKANELKQLEKISKAVIFVFSSGGFYNNTIAFLEDNGIAWSEDKRFLD